MNTNQPSPGIRFFSKLAAAVAMLLMTFGLLVTVSSAVAAPIRVVVWDERQELQKTGYHGEYLGNTLAGSLSKQPGLSVKSVGLNDPNQGLSDDILDNCDVLIWWGHQKHGDVTPEHVKAVVDRVKEGRISLIALHSAHWSKPFIGVMNERAIHDALMTVPQAERSKVKIVTVPPPGGMPKPSGPMSPSSRRFKAADGTDTLEVTMPSCVFPYVANDGKPGHLTTLMPEHPIAKGVPANFDVPQTEVYGGPFHVPKPDVTIFEEKWDSGHSFPSGCAWTVGKGKVFYFRPGHETYPIYTQEVPLKIVVNAIHWEAGK